MGLDQYLYAKKFAHNSSWAKDEDKQLFASLVAISKAEEFMEKDFPSAFVEVKVAQWRKQNAIHNWFVQECQGGEDECQTVSVEREKLEELRDLCRQVLADTTLADELLPTSNGFFFGSTDYDGWYIEGLTYTADTIDRLLTMSNDWDFEYSSSW
jgi:hypothetical protein